MMMKKEPKCSVCPDDVKSIPKNLKKYQVGTPTYSGGMLPMATVSSPMSESPIARNLRVKKALQEGRDVNTAKTANEKGFENTVKELSGAGSVERIYKDPVGTLKGTAIAASNVLALPIGIASGMGEVAQGREFDMGQNPFTGRKISEGFDKALDVATVLPAVGLLGKGVGAAGKAVRAIPAVDRGMNTASRVVNTAKSLATEFKSGLTAKNPSGLFETPVSTLSPERLKYLKEVNRLSAYGDEVKASSNQKLIAAGDPSAATKKQLYEKYLQSSLTEEDLMNLSGMDKARLKHELSLMNIVDEPKIKKAIDPNFPDYSQNVGTDADLDELLLQNPSMAESPIFPSWSQVPTEAQDLNRYVGAGGRQINIRPVVRQPPPLPPAEAYAQPRRSLLESINLQRPVRENFDGIIRGRRHMQPKVERAIERNFEKYGDASYNLGVGFKEALTKKLRKVAPTSEFVESSTKKVKSEPLLSVLYKQGNTGKEVMQKVSEAKQAYITAKKGHYKAASSLSSNSFPLYTTMISNLKKSVPNTRYSIDGFSELNSSGYIDQLGGSNEEIAGFLNEHISKLNLDGKKIPKVFVKDGKVMYPKINLEKYKLGGYANKGDGKGNLPKFQLGSPMPTKQQYQDSIQTNYQSHLENTGGASPLPPGVNLGMNCINGVCNFIKGTNAHKFGGKGYTGNATFNDEREKNGYYEADWRTTGFEVGDVVQYARTKDNAERIDGMKITPKNAKELYPQHAKVILNTRVDDRGRKMYTIGHNGGGIKFTTSEIAEEELMKHGVEGYGTYNGLIVNRYDPEKVKESKAALLARQAVFQGNNEHASKYNTPPNFIYKGAKGAKSEQNMVDYFKKNYQALGKQSNMSPETLHKAFTNIVGIGHQESDLGGNMEVKMPQFLMDEARTLRDNFSTEDDWKKDYWKSNADGVQSKYKSEAEFKKALASRSPISPEVSEYLYLNSPRSKGTFKQKELSERGRFFDSNLDSEEKQFVSAMQLYMDNYDVVKKKYPGKTDDEYLDLATLMHNAPSKALTPEYVEYYQKNNKMDYVNKVKVQRGELVIGETFKPSGTNLIGAKDSTLANATSAPRMATPTKLSPKEVETLKAFMNKK